eukprot:maker-scaffold469_size162558-snap-gene-0.28 protein:Tk06429 transcript:maker-scaffold469_size162558-snap-gene-0.28-mRNA-1 annotation:"uncharacterized protein LOC101741444"
MKSLCWAYFFWLFGGFLGAHHLYLRRYKQAFVWWCLPGGYFGGGWFRDIWRIPEYVRDANNDPDYLKELSEKMRSYPRPPLSWLRMLGQLLMGNVFSVVLHMGMPNKEDFGRDLDFIPFILGPAATALGIWVVGNIGRQQGSLLPPTVACYGTYLLKFAGFPSNGWICIAGIIAFQWKSREWSRTIRRPEPFWRTTLILVICALLYTSLWSSYVYYNMRVVTKEGDEIPILDLPKGATQEEIKLRYREMSKKWHPDKQTKEDNKVEAAERFVEVQQAYERLSDIKNRRTKRNKSST